MYSSFQAACLRRARMLIRGVRLRPMRLMAILRRMARLRAAVRSRTRLSSSRKVTLRTQWSSFSIVQCRGRPNSDTGGEFIPQWSCDFLQGGEPRAAGPSGWNAVQPVCDPHQVDGGGADEVLQVRFGEPDRGRMKVRV